MTREFVAPSEGEWIGWLIEKTRKEERERIAEAIEAVAALNMDGSHYQAALLHAVDIARVGGAA